MGLPYTRTCAGGRGVAPDDMAFMSHMSRALDLAREAAASGEVPVGAVIVGPKGVVAEARNSTRADHDPTAHAEIAAIRAACAKLGQERLEGYDLYVTLEPCAMCAGAIAAARIRQVYFGAFDPKSGGVEHGARVFSHPQCHHRPEVFGGVSELEAQTLLRDFFAQRRR